VDQGELPAGKPGELAPDIDGVRGDRRVIDGDEDLFESQGSLLREKAA